MSFPDMLQWSIVIISLIGGALGFHQIRRIYGEGAR